LFYQTTLSVWNCIPSLERGNDENRAHLRGLAPPFALIFFGFAMQSINFGKFVFTDETENS